MSQTTPPNRRERVRARRQALMRSHEARQRAGRIMVVTAAIGIAVVIIGVAVSWKLIGDINQATQDTLDVTIESLQSLEATIDLADELIGSTSGSLESVESTLGTVATSFTTGSATVDELGDLTDTTEPALRDAVVTLRQLEDIGGQIDGALAGLSSLPIGPDYDPDATLAETFGQLAEDIEPLPDELGETSDSLSDLETTLAALEADTEQLAGDIGALNEGLSDSEALIADYRGTVDRAQDVAQRSRSDLAQDETLLRLVLLVAGVNFAVAQIVPLWIGWELQDGDRVGRLDLAGPPEPSEPEPDEPEPDGSTTVTRPAGGGGG